jgi:5-methylcytosine-specific restriction protein A
LCEDHAREDRRRYDAARGGSSARGYGARWRKLRRIVLAKHPFCQAPGCTAPATEVDHIVPRVRGGDDREANLQALCKACHSAKTAREDGRWG